MHIIKFIKAFFADWIAWMSGGVSVALAIWIVYFPPISSAENKTLWWIAAALCILFASYRVWLREHKQVELLKQKPEPALPNLIGHSQIIDISYYEGFIDKDKPTTQITLRVGMANDSPIPTTLEGFSLSVKTADKTFTADSPMKINTEVLFWTENKQNKKALKNYLGDYAKPIRMGKHIEGLLIFSVNGLRVEDMNSDAEFILLIKDAWGKFHRIVNKNVLLNQEAA